MKNPENVVKLREPVPPAIVQKPIAYSPYLPPWWPQVVNDAGVYKLFIRGAVINNTFPRTDWSDSGTGIDRSTTFIELDDESGVICVRCDFGNALSTNFNEVTIDKHPVVPADDVPFDRSDPGYFHIVTHFYQRDTIPGTMPVQYKYLVRPMYFHSLRAVRYGREFRW